MSYCTIKVLRSFVLVLAFGLALSSCSHNQKHVDDNVPVTAADSTANAPAANKAPADSLR